jgi:hypothetical protein
MEVEVVRHHCRPHDPHRQRQSARLREALEIGRQPGHQRRAIGRHDQQFDQETQGDRSDQGGDNRFHPAEAASFQTKHDQRIARRQDDACP